MIESITLEGFKSFGERQTVPLQGITVLVGPNNSGKSNFLSVGRLFANAANAKSGKTALEAEGGLHFVTHRSQRLMTIEISVGWAGTDGGYSTDILQEGNEIWAAPLSSLRSPPHPSSRHDWCGTLLEVWSDQPSTRTSDWLGVILPLVESREVALSPEALTKDAPVEQNPALAPDGSGMAAVLALWRGGEPDKAIMLEEFIREALPEIKHVLAKPAPTPGHQRLWIQQVDGELFDAEHVSDGVLHFIALAMHAIDAPPGALIFVEDPEDSIHPRQLSRLVDLLRKLVKQRGCQFVLATHSPTLLDEFRDEPEAIILFRRGEHGTVTKCLSELPKLVERLQNVQPGELLANGFFSDPF